MVIVAYRTLRIFQSYFYKSQQKTLEGAGRNPNNIDGSRMDARNPNNYLVSRCILMVRKHRVTNLRSHRNAKKISQDLRYNYEAKTKMLSKNRFSLSLQAHSMSSYQVYVATYENRGNLLLAWTVIDILCVQL